MAGMTPQADEPIRCRDCDRPAWFRASVAKQPSNPNERIRIYQCSNCARLIWKE